MVIVSMKLCCDLLLVLSVLISHNQASIMSCILNDMNISCLISHNQASIMSCMLNDMNISCNVVS